jgi:hypothetical protein
MQLLKQRKGRNEMYTLENTTKRVINLGDKSYTEFLFCGVWYSRVEHEANIKASIKATR